MITSTVKVHRIQWPEEIDSWCTKLASSLNNLWSLCLAQTWLCVIHLLMSGCTIITHAVKKKCQVQRLLWDGHRGTDTHFGLTCSCNRTQYETTETLWAFDMCTDNTTMTDVRHYWHHWQNPTLSSLYSQFIIKEFIYNKDKQANSAYVFVFPTF